MSKVEKNTVNLKLEDIKNDPKNEKVHTQENLRLIKKSLTEMGYLNPIIVDETNTILAGHGRKQALEELGHESIDVLKITGLSKVQKKKFRLYDNQSARTGHMDNELVVETVEEILNMDNDFDISILGLDGLAESFSTEIASFTASKTKLDPISSGTKAIVFIGTQEDLDAIVKATSTMELSEELTTSEVKFNVK
jgi:hypothetical protein